ncbi:MAG: malonic semialdehyde reductase [Hyphomonadaceae bacterium]
MSDPVNDYALDTIWRDARTRNGWQDKAVPEVLMRAVYDLAKMGATSANCSPARFIFIHTDEAKARLKPHLSEGNVQKTMDAPWTVIIAHDMQFQEKLPQLFPHNPDAKDWFGEDEKRIETAGRNGTLQGAYLMLAARSLGLDCGPLSGFDAAGVDKEFFTDKEMGDWKSDFLCNIGYGNDTDIFPRSPRLAFEEACRIL